jgi:hypothetical protein
MAADLNAMLTRFDERVRVVYTARMYVGRLRE